MKNFQIVVTKSHGGVTNRYEWDNVYKYEFDGNLDDPRHVANMLWIVGEEKKLYDPSVLIKDATCTELELGGDYVPDLDHVSRTYNVAGVRTVTGDLLPFEIALGIDRVAAKGSNGRCVYKGALYESDVEVLADGRYSLVPAVGNNAAAVANEFKDQMTGYLPNGNFVFPLHPDRFRSVNRRIIEHRVVGVVQRQLTNYVTTWEQDMELGAQKLMNEAEAKLKKIRARSNFLGFSATELEQFAQIAATIIAIMRVLPQARMLRVTFGALWSGITIPPLRTTPLP